MRTPRRLLETCKALVGRRVVLVRAITTRGGVVHRKGWVYRVDATWRGRFSITRITPGGRTMLKRTTTPCGWLIAFHVRKVERRDFDVLPEPGASSGDHAVALGADAVVGARPVLAVAGRPVD